MTTFFSWQQAILKSTLEPTTRLVCLTIGCHMALDGSGCFPSYALIAEECGLGRSTVIAHVHKAVEAGYLSLANRARENGSSTSNLYRPVMPQVVQQRDGGSPAPGLGVVQQLDPHNTPSLTPQNNIPPTPKGEPEGFKEFWEAYPNKVKKPKAMAIWRRLKANHADVMAGLRRWKASEQWTKDNGKYVPHPTSWLNAEGWNDAIAGEVAPLSAAELAAATRRHEEAAQRSKAHLDNLARQRSNQLLGLSDDAA